MDSERPSTSALSAAAGYAVGAVGYAMLLGVMGLVLAGGGHGMFSPFWIGFSGLILWPAAGAAIVWAHRPVGRAAFVATMSLQYLVTVAVMLANKDGAYLERVWTALGWLVLMYVVTYLAGQGVLWGAYVSRARPRPDRSPRRVR